MKLIWLESLKFAFDIPDSDLRACAERLPRPGLFYFSIGRPVTFNTYGGVRCVTGS